MTDLLDQVYADNSKNPKPFTTNVNNSVTSESLRLSNVSGLSAYDSKNIDY